MRKIGLKDFYNYKYISSLTLSPEGDKLAYNFIKPAAGRHARLPFLLYSFFLICSRSRLPARRTWPYLPRHNCRYFL